MIHLTTKAHQLALRRTFLKHGMLGAAGIATLPAWIESAFGVQDPKKVDGAVGNESDDPRVRAVRAAWRRAKAYGKPLIVLVIPDEDTDKYARGQALGAWLNHTTSTSLSDLALGEVACATPEELLTALDMDLDRAAKLKGATFVMAEAGRSTEAPTLTSTAVEITEAPNMRGLESYEKYLKNCAEWSERTKSALAAGLTALVVPSKGVLVDRADAVRAQLDEVSREALEAWFKSSGPAPAAAAIHRAAAIVRMESEAPRTAGARKRLLEALHAAIQTVVIKQPVPGARWANGMGCGVTFEDGKNQMGIACGMGSVPAECERFLHFFVN